MFLLVVSAWIRLLVRSFRQLTIVDYRLIRRCLAPLQINLDSLLHVAVRS